MDVLEFLAVMIPILMGGFLVFKWIGLADARARIELQKRLAKSKNRDSAAQRREIEETGNSDIADWVPQLLEQFGVDPDVIFQDEMPAELKTLVPLAKGFIQSGGLQKLIAPKEEGGSIRQTI